MNNNLSADEHSLEKLRKKKVCNNNKEKIDTQKSPNKFLSELEKE